MIANLQMYDWPELQESYQQYWALIRDGLRHAGLKAPDELSRVSDESTVWLRPDLVLSQTCGMPYRLSLHGKVCLIGTPDYGVAECPAGHYRSVFVVRENDSRNDLAEFSGSTFAFNNRYSQSGYAAPFFHASERGFWFSERRESGGHKASARMVAESAADIASLDAVSWRFMERYDEFATRLRVIELTEPTPGLPYIAATGTDRRVLFNVVNDAIHALPEAARTELGISGLIDYSPEDYLAIPTPK